MRRPGFGGCAGASSGVAQSARDEVAAAHGRALRQAVDPAHGVGPLFGGALEPSQEGIEVGDALRALHDPGDGTRCMRDGDLEDVTGETHAAHGGQEQLSLLVGTTNQHAPIRHAHAQREHVVPEATLAVLALAVHVGGDHAAQGHVLGAGGDGGEPRRGRKRRFISSSERPASACSTPVCSSKPRMRSASVVLSARGRSAAGSDASP
jgi:hypothetical protein